MYADELDDLIKDAIKIVCQYDRASASLLQRRLMIGYARAARLMDQLETIRVLSASDESSRPREVLVKDAEEFIKNLPPMKLPPAEEPPVPEINYNPRKATFLPKEILENKNQKEIVLGTDEKGKVVKVDFGKIGNLIITGNPISKKYEFIESFLLSVLSNLTPSQIKLVIYDSTFSFLKYGKMPHLLSPIIDSWEKAISALRWTVAETNRRFKVKEKFPEIYFIYNFDFNDVEREDLLKILSSMAFKVGVHLIILTDSFTEISKGIRDNIPAKLTFDKFGENNAIYEFDKKIPVETATIKSSEVDNYLKNI